MENKRITIKEIAKEAGVSTATVSYVINGRTDQKISAVQKEKILEIAKKYHYNRNSVASALVIGKYNLAVMCFPLTNCLFKQTDYYSAFCRLNRAFEKIGVGLFMSDDALEKTFEVDNIICIGLDGASLKTIRENNGVPISIIDSLNDCGKTFEDDYSSFKGEEKMISLPLTPSYEEYIRKHFDLTVAHSILDIDAYFASSNNQKVYIRDSSLNSYCLQKGYKAIYLDSFSEEKVSKIVDYFRSK